MTYAVSYSVQWDQAPSPLMDDNFPRLCEARGYRWRNGRPVYQWISDLDTDFQRIRYIEDSEPCQHCETPFSRMVR